ncbi:MAG: hypothetical protein UX91_C0003G0064 [Candidatus Amesbacteria bacterium GW2011_GWB1_47_19]|nr:MAG: hypothetical protein UW51_C0003G0070 [Candidatus Amesbacteria bacterium GW2011_GWA1_44_24]KKU31495.1 MAG: hypothetical protein UX46_C0005G0064 [Candidatus Amesbacteria bacterium GW2011_GWC1_46_24]KKU67503.1 MAG: hypothetical protein UX91_C0003G0064 [Candidatus Amesbacteria bacterium GW2011_GWB1_47_19]
MVLEAGVGEGVADGTEVGLGVVVGLGVELGLRVGEGTAVGWGVGEGVISASVPNTAVDSGAGRVNQ